MTVHKFLRSHKKWLVFSGPLILFATFITKDVLRDNYKELSDSVGMAESVFLIRDDVQMLKTDEAVAQPDNVQDESVYGLQVALRIEGTGTAISQISRLLKSLAHNTPEAGELRKLEQDQEEQARQSRTLAMDRLKHTMDGDTSWKSPAYIAILDLAAKNRLLWLKTNDLGGRVLAKATEVEESYERRYKAFRNLSYFLYLIGWALLFLATIYGIKDVATLG